MANKEIQARVKHKRDTSSNWTQNNPVLLNGEIVLVDTAEGELRAKIGDGTKTYTQLPFSDEVLRSLINNNKVTVDDELSTDSTNPVQNKVVTTEINGIKTLVGDTSVSEQITNALSGIEPGAEVNVQSNWSETDTSSDAYILNKPAISAGSASASIQEGWGTTATAEGAHAEGSWTKATGGYSHAEGGNSEAQSKMSHAEGYHTIASNLSAHAEGYESIASGHGSHAEGRSTASGDKSHAEGYFSVASGDYSHSEGFRTIAQGDNQHAHGKYNIADTENKYASIVGNGYYDSDNSTAIRSNAHTLDWSGNAWFSGNIKVGGAGYSDSNAKAIATQEYVDSNHPTVDDVLSNTSTNAIQNKVVNSAIENLQALIGDTSVASQIAAAVQSMLPKVTTITLGTDWTGTASPYYQDVTLSCVTETSVVDLQPTPTQLAEWQDAGIAFTTQSGDGTVRVYIAGTKPTAEISVQVKVQEVVQV